MVYEIAEDSILIGKYVEKFSKGKVLDIGTGNGYLMEIALKKTKNVEGADVDEESIKICNEKNLNVYYSDLFSNVKGKFNLIIFNPPYLPREEGMKEHKDLFGGKHGWEIIERFFKDVKNHLEKNGKILIVFSNLTNKNKVDSIIRKNKFNFKLLEEKNIGLMEKLYAYILNNQRG